MACKPPEVAALVDTYIGSNYALYAVRMHRRVVVFHARGLPAYAQYHNSKDPFRCISDEATAKDHKDAQRQWVADLKVIFLTKFINAYHQFLRGWNDDTLRDIERGMDAYQALKRADLLEYAHEVYGHITSEDRVVGYVTESMTGRTIQPRDKKLLYSAVARLHRAGLCYAGFHESNTLPSFSRSGLQTRLKRDVAQSGFCASNLLIYDITGDEGEVTCREDECIDARVKFIDLAGIEPASDEGNRLDWESVERLFAGDDEGSRTSWPSPSEAQDSYIVIPSYPKCLDLRAFLPQSRNISPPTSQSQEKRKQLIRSLGENGSSAKSEGVSSTGSQ
ncbi:hypothetical protein EV121DRAFT_295943 [Schizophyllum commune]